MRIFLRCRSPIFRVSFSFAALLLEARPQTARPSRRQLNTHPRQLQGLRVRASRAFHAAVRKTMLKVSAGKSGTDEGTCQSLRREAKSELDFEAPLPE